MFCQFNADLALDVCGTEHAQQTWPNAIYIIDQRIYNLLICAAVHQSVGSVIARPTTVRVRSQEEFQR